MKSFRFRIPRRYSRPFRGKGTAYAGLAASSHFPTTPLYTVTAGQCAFLTEFIARIDGPLQLCFRSDDYAPGSLCVGVPATALDPGPAIAGPGDVLNMALVLPDGAVLTGFWPAAADAVHGFRRFDDPAEAAEAIAAHFVRPSRLP